VLVSASLGGAFAHAESRDSAALGAWQDYALGSITPDFDWAEQQNTVAPTALSLALEADASRAPSIQLIPSTENLKLSVSFGSELVGDLPAAGQSVSALSPTLTGAGLERNYFSPSLTQRIGDETTISGAAVFVYQQFATWGMGTGVSTPQLNSGPPFSTVVREDSVGTGARVQLNRNLEDGIDLVASAQSRINMNAFQSYRGVFSDPGDFDIPAVAGLGMLWDANSRLQIGVGVNRVMWSDIEPFTSSALPRSLLRLLGDGTSPTFAWRDLTVYDFDVGFRATRVDTISLTMTSHQQPEPTSAVLRRALDEGSSDVDFGVRYGHDFGLGGRLSIGASYAPADYYFGYYSYSDRNTTGNQIEVEAIWSMDF
jgi:hypothetical protein